GDDFGGGLALVLPAGGDAQATQIVKRQGVAIEAGRAEPAKVPEHRRNLLGGQHRSIDTRLVGPLDQLFALVLLGVDLHAQIEAFDAVAPVTHGGRQGLRTIDGDLRDVEPRFALPAILFDVFGDHRGTWRVEAGHRNLRAAGL